MQLRRLGPTGRLVLLLGATPLPARYSGFAAWLSSKGVAVNDSDHAVAACQDHDCDALS